MLSFLIGLGVISASVWLLLWQPIVGEGAKEGDRSSQVNNSYTATSITVQLTGNALPLLCANDATAPDEIVLDVVEKLLYRQSDLVACCNEGDAGMMEGEAVAFWESLDRAGRSTYVSMAGAPSDTAPDALTPTENIVVIIVVLFYGHQPEVETAIASVESLSAALNALRGIANREGILSAVVHRLPAAAGHNLSGDQVLINFPNLIKI
jgi:Protein of unknown function (DUF1517)